MCGGGGWVGVVVGAREQVKPGTGRSAGSYKFPGLLFGVHKLVLIYQKESLVVQIFELFFVLCLFLIFVEICSKTGFGSRISVAICIQICI